MIAAALAGCILLLGVLRRVDVYAAFSEGAREGLRTAVGVAPYLCAALMMTAALRESGLLESVGSLLSPMLKAVGIPRELLPFLVLRPVSGSGALSALGELMETHGADSRIARMAAVMMGSGETVLYVLPVYLGAAGLRSPRYVLWASLAAMAVGTLLAAVIAA